MAYAASMTPEQAAASNHEGCKKCVPVTCCGFPGMVGTYWFACRDNCLWFPCCFMGIALPVYSCVCCSCERQSNSWITRDKHGNMTGAFMLLDHENGTIGWYGVKCCSTQLEEKPQCYCVK